MKLKDYKFWCINRNDNGQITWAAIRFYEGEYEKIKRKDIDSEIEYESDEYVRTKKLQKVDLTDLGNIKIKKDAKGNDTVLYTTEDFGVISTDDELREFLNEQLDKVKGLEPIAKQKWQKS